MENQNNIEKWLSAEDLNMISKIKQEMNINGRFIQWDQPKTIIIKVNEVKTENNQFGTQSMLIMGVDETGQKIRFYCPTALRTQIQKFNIIKNIFLYIRYNGVKTSPTTNRMFKSFYVKPYSAAE